ncbi:MAG: HD domain-containing protein [Candidatus Latescibacteria bacterium]|nr:HD domain-containing protein [Candidatus Latescibacterota bacterium]
MRLCAVKDLEEGMVLGKSIYQPNGKLLLGAGYRIDTVMMGKLAGRGYTHVYVMEEGTEDVVPEDIISDEVSFQAKNRLAGKVLDIRNQKEFQDATVDQATRLIEKGYLKSVNITYDMRKIVEEILKDVSAAGAKLMNTVMVKTADTYFMDHALNVTVLAIMMGKKYRFHKKEIMSLGLGCFLHDIGKTIIEQMKGAKDAARASELYREHPTFGYLILNNSPNVSPLETQIVNQHHEQQDGGGFPIGLKGENIPPIKMTNRKMKGFIFRLAEICSVANAFDNIVFNPYEKDQKSPDKAIKQLILEAGSKYNKDVVRTLLKVVPYYPVGATVKVIDIVDPGLVGYVGVVARIKEGNINKPTIILTKNKFLKKIKPIVVDTSNFSHVELKLLV